MAGRKSLRDEVVQAEVINLSWHTLRRAMHSKSITQKEKMGIALEICKKTCPTKVDFGGDTVNAIAQIFGVITDAD